MNIAVLACSNGLGHTRRVVAIASFMLKSGFEGNIDAFLPLAHLEKLWRWEPCSFFVNHPNVRTTDFYYPQKAEAKTVELYNKDWQTIELPDLDKYDVVWSDNILQVLEVRPDTKLTGSFLWHEVFENSKETNGLSEFVQSQKNILTKYKPEMAGNEYFATPEVKDKTRFFPVGLYKYSHLLKEKSGRSILISCGLGGEEEEQTRQAIEEIIGTNTAPPEYLYVEPRVLPKSYPSWIKKATFTSDMFHDCMAVCIRPGMGTISDALVHHSRIFAFSRNDSFEMLHNSDVLQELRVGERCESPFGAYLKAIDFVNSEVEIENQLLKTGHLRTDGVFATSNFILRKKRTLTT